MGGLLVRLSSGEMKEGMKGYYTIWITLGTLRLRMMCRRKNKLKNIFKGSDHMFLQSAGTHNTKCILHPSGTRDNTRCILQPKIHMIIPDAGRTFGCWTGTPAPSFCNLSLFINECCETICVYCLSSGGTSCLMRHEVPLVQLRKCLSG